MSNRTENQSGAVVKLDVAAALMSWFHNLGQDVSRAKEDLRRHSMSWQAFCDLLDRIKEGGFGGHRGHHPRPRVHLSSLSRAPAWECDRALACYMANETRGLPVNTRSNPSGAGTMMRVFHFGKGVELSLYPLIVPALEDYYGSRLQILGIWFERPVYGPGTHASAEEILELVGTADITIHYVLDGVEARCVWDCKSTSQNRSEKRVQKGVVVTEPEYERQVSSYLEPTRSDYGGVLYWIKSPPHLFQQVYVDRAQARYERNVKRVVRIRQGVEGGDAEPVARMGSYCLTHCEYWESCPALHAARPDLFGRSSTPASPLLQVSHE